MEITYSTYSVNSCRGDREVLYKQFARMLFDTIQKQSKAKQSKKDTWTEVFADLDIKLPDLVGTHKLKIKVDTRAEGNTLPFHIFH